MPYSPLGRGLLGGWLDATTVADSPFRANDPRVVLYLTEKDTTATLYLIVIGSKYIQGNFSWHNPSFEITYNEITQEYLIEDKANGFCLICDGGIILVESTKGSNFEIIQ